MADLGFLQETEILLNLQVKRLVSHCCPADAWHGSDSDELCQVAGSWLT